VGDGFQTRHALCEDESKGGACGGQIRLIESEPAVFSALRSAGIVFPKRNAGTVAGAWTLRRTRERNVRGKFERSRL
jgi:hypothetical protein